MGSAFGHLALGVEDIYAACDKIKSLGGNVTREAGPVKVAQRTSHLSLTQTATKSN